MWKIINWKKVSERLAEARGPAVNVAGNPDKITGGFSSRLEKLARETSASSEK